MYRRAIYWFKRDLRIEDNRAFWEACKKSKELIPVFIFIPELLDKFKAHDSRLGFIVESIKNLSNEIERKGGRLFCYKGNPYEVFQYLIKKYKPEAAFTVRAFSWSGQALEERVVTLCKDEGIPLHSIVDNFLSKLDRIPYKKVFTPFYRHWKSNVEPLAVPNPHRINVPNIEEPDINSTILELTYNKNNFWSVPFGLERLEDFDFSGYEYSRDRMDIDGTSKLSPYIRFGLISLRKIYQKALEAAGEDCQFIKELAWREFWYHIKINFQEFNILEFQEKRRNIQWENNEKFINAFINAKTGYPIIDAAIIQLKTEGWMHNRARMIVASFLTKDLLVDWRVGERFFMEYLLDYDEVVNTGNWQWNASVGPDPKPLRIFNPILQAKKFDPEAKFIKKYIPELSKLPAYMLHDPLEYEIPYYKPIVNHYERILLAKKRYFEKST